QILPRINSFDGFTCFNYNSHGGKYFTLKDANYNFPSHYFRNVVNELLSEGNKKVTRVRKDQSYPYHPDRFDQCPQLLCTTGLTGRCYWEVEWRGKVHTSVSYRGIRRNGDSEDSWFGKNDQSWSLICSDVSGYSVWHNNRVTPISSSCVSHRVAVYVDCPAGSLSFCRVSSDSLIHLHTFNTTFTEPLYPGFGFWSYFCIWELKSITCKS
uniref:B30.2/SPRY domain-containing protein n=1 Tax=Seriola dumerili TaxID=41447 RepID=A0A3B4TFP5_SERDU